MNIARLNKPKRRATFCIGASIMSNIQRRLVTFDELKAFGVPFTRQHLARLEKVNKFPRRIQLTPGKWGRVVWDFPAVEAWLASRVTEAA